MTTSIIHRGVVLPKGMTSSCLDELARLLNEHCRVDCEDSDAEGVVKVFEVVRRGIIRDESEIEITPAVIAAGVAAMGRHHYRHAESDPWEDQVVSIFRAMRSASSVGCP